MMIVMALIGEDDDIDNNIDGDDDIDDDEDEDDNWMCDGE